MQGILNLFINFRLYDRFSGFDAHAHARVRDHALTVTVAPFAACQTYVEQTEIDFFVGGARFIATEKSEKLMCIPLTKSATFFRRQFYIFFFPRKKNWNASK